MSHDVSPHQASRHDPVYERLHDSPDFTELKRRYQAFVFPATAAFLGWYLLYVLLSTFAHDFMSKEVVGNINVALVLGLLQFVSTFLIAYLYSRYSAARIDPLARKLEDEFHAEKGL